MVSKKYDLINECGHDFHSNNFYVYELINPYTNLPFYVGKGRDSRAWRHVSLRNNVKHQRTNPHKSHTINKIINDGGCVIIRIVSTHESEEEAFVHEQTLISSHGRIVDGTGILTNITTGGEGYTHDGIPVVQYTMWGAYVTEYKNAKEAARIHGWKTYGTICACCKKRERSYKGFLWSYVGDHPTILMRSVPVYQWTLSGEFVNVHRNTSAAARSVSCDPSTISDCLNGYNRQAVGFMWSRTNTPPTLRESKSIIRVVEHINTGRIYNSVTSAAKATNHSVGDVSGCCNGRKKSIGGDTFRYVVDQ